MSIISIFLILLVPASISASSNDACFDGGCHNSSSTKPIDRLLYDSNPHKIIKCIECHEPSIDPGNSNHGQFIRQLNGSNITGPLTTHYYSNNFSLCYFCHDERNVVGFLPGWIPSSNHVNITPIIVSSIGSNFINVDPNGYHNGSQTPGVFDVPTNIHWNHLDAFGSINAGSFGLFDSNMDGTPDSYQSCPACHNVHGTNYPKMTKNDLAISYDSNGTFGYIGSDAYLNYGGDVYCTGCHTSGTTFKYYRNEINLFGDCVSCHVNGSTGGVNRTAFSQGVHVDVNLTGGSGAVNNADCGTCHYNKDMIRSNIWQCNNCHTEPGKPEASLAPKIKTHISGVKITNYSCVDCHSKVIVDPGTGIVNITSHYLKRPTISSENYCDYCHGPNPNSPFNATNKTIPAFNHNSTDWNGNATCRTCHSNSSVQADPLANDSSSFHDLTTELGDVYDGTRVPGTGVKADCVICHIQKSAEFVTAPDLPLSHPPLSGTGAEGCYGCHGSGSGSQPQQLHSVEPIGSGCIGCHSNNATRYYVNTNMFGNHKNVNGSDGDNINVTDSDCKTCHYESFPMVLGAANSSNTRYCNFCHTKSLSHGKTDCKWCHAADNQPDYRYHTGGPLGTAAGKDCGSCHLSTNLKDRPFHAPGISHSVYDTNGEECGNCHPPADTHQVQYKSSSARPSISGLSITTPVKSGDPAQVQATVTDVYLQVAAAQYQVTTISGNVVINWTNMTPQDGGFNYYREIVIADLDTSILAPGIYKVNIQGMASAPRTESSKPYYPLNGRWSFVSIIQLIVTQPEGYVNGTVIDIYGNSIAGAIVITNTSVRATTNENGFYSLSLVGGEYVLTTSKDPEFYLNNTVMVTSRPFNNIIQNITMGLKPTGNIAGKVTII